MGVVDASSHNSRASTLNGFMFGSGPSRRYVGEMAAEVAGENALPGGVSGVLGDANYMSLLPMWLTNRPTGCRLESEQAVLSVGHVSAEVTWKSQYSGRQVRSLCPSGRQRGVYCHFSGSSNPRGRGWRVPEPRRRQALSPLVWGPDGPRIHRDVHEHRDGQAGQLQPSCWQHGGRGQHYRPSTRDRQATYWSKDGEWSETLQAARTGLDRRNRGSRGGWKIRFDKSAGRHGNCAFERTNRGQRDLER